MGGILYMLKELIFPSKRIIRVKLEAEYTHCLGLWIVQILIMQLICLIRIYTVWLIGSICVLQVKTLMIAIICVLFCNLFILPKFTEIKHRKSPFILSYASRLKTGADDAIGLWTYFFMKYWGRCYRILSLFSFGN